MRSRLVLVVLPLLLVLACSDDPDEVRLGGDGGRSKSPPDQAAAADDPLDGRTFVAILITEGEADRRLVAGTELRLGFDDGQLSVTAGCNSLSGPYTLDGEVLTVSDLAGTEMGCGPALMEQDTWIADVLSRDVTVSVEGAELTVSAADTTIFLTDREVAGPDASLVGNTWMLDSLIDGVTVSSVPVGVTATVTFADDGTYSLSPGCNNGGGAYLFGVDSTGRETLHLDAPALTRKACGGDAGSVEAAVLAVFEGTVDYDIIEQSLTLTKDELRLGFRAS